MFAGTSCSVYVGQIEIRARRTLESTPSSRSTMSSWWFHEADLESDLLSWLYYGTAGSSRNDDVPRAVPVVEGVPELDAESVRACPLPQPRARPVPRARSPLPERVCAVCLDSLDGGGASASCASCSQTIHAACHAAWAEAVASRGREPRCPSCRSLWRSSPAAAAAVDYEAIDSELEWSRARVRSRMTAVLERSFHRKSPLRSPLAIASLSDGSGSRATSTPKVYLTTQIFQAMSYLDRNFNVVHPCAQAQRVRWQDGSFGPFYQRWTRLQAPDADRSIHSLIVLLEGLERGELAVYDGGVDVTRDVFETLRPLRDLDDAIRDCARLLELYRPETEARALQEARDERDRDRDDREHQEAHRLRLIAAMA